MAEFVPQSVSILILRYGPSRVANENRLQALGISRGEDLSNWGLPGGKVDPGESIRFAACRELEEETQIWVPQDSVEPVFTQLSVSLQLSENDPEITNYLNTTFIVAHSKVVLPDPLPSSREGTVMWKFLDEYLTDSCTFREYNRKLFEHLHLLS
jgi:8-oxo-dGTP pyrophosphatase MutT (NUDIX family)